MLASLALPHYSFGQTTEQNYYESSSALSSGAIAVASFGAVYQTFRPSNDFVSGFDVWLDNTGGSGTLRFALTDNTDTTLSSNSVSVGALTPKWGGTRVHLDLGANVSVSSTAVYKLKLWTSMPQLKIYYVNSVSVLEHNASILLNTENIIRPAFLDSTQQTFVFKIAFYEKSTDTAPPSVSNLSFTAPNSNQMIVGLNANEPVDYKIDYRTTYAPSGIVDIEVGTFTNAYNFCIDAITPCAFTIPVYPNVTYQYQLYVRDYWGNQTVLSGTFDSSKNGAFQVYSTSTPATSTSTVSIISNAKVAALTPTSAQFTWDTDIPSASRVLVSTDAAGTQVVARLGDNTFELSHSLSTGDILTPQTNYYALIVADSYSSLLQGTQLTFTTPAATAQPAPTPAPPAPAPAPAPAPIIPQSITIKTLIDNAFSASSSASITNPSQSLPNLTITTRGNVGSLTTTIRWTPHAGASGQGYQVDIFDINQKLVKRVTVKNGTNTINIEGLPPGEYRAVAYVEKNGSYEKIAQSTNFKAVAKGQSFWENIGSETVLISVAGFGLLMIMIAAIMAAIKKNEIANL